VRPHLGYYVHHQGRGHLHRAAAVLAHLATPCTVATSAPDRRALGDAVEVLSLPLDVPDGPAEVRAAATAAVPLPPVLHHAPIGVAGLRTRVARLASWFDACDPAAVVVDVSVEVTLLARLSGVAPVVVRQHGDRSDPPHRAAYAAAAGLLAPWPVELEDPTAPQEVRDRTWYVGGFSRFDGRTLPRAVARRQLGLERDRPTVVVLEGTGGTATDPARIDAAAASTPGWRWLVLGAGDQAARDPAARDQGEQRRRWVEDPFPWLRAADVVVTHAGHNAVMEADAARARLMEAAAARARLVVVPAPRPRHEQQHKAGCLAELGAAVVVPTWPDPAAWPGVLARAEGLDPAVLGALVDGGGARRAAAHLDGLVARLTS
jgi:hypothetical protein